MVNNGLIKLQEFRTAASYRLFEAGNVSKINNSYIVDSESDPTQFYKVSLTVDYRGLQCECPDFSKRGKWLDCKHVEAVKVYEYEKAAIEIMA